VDRKEGMLHSDSPTNLMWRLQNNQVRASRALEAEEPSTDEPSFTDITLDVRRTGFGTTGFGKTGFGPV
jgi:twitching motility protein PilU